MNSASPPGEVAERRAKTQHYVAAIGLVLFAAAAQLLLDPYLPPSLHLFFYPAIVFAAWIGGLGPGIVATVGSSVAIALLIMPPSGVIRVTTRDALDLAIFSSVSFLVVILISRTQRAMAREAAAKTRAERASAAKDEMLAIVSHDLKNPLGTVALSADLIRALVAQQQLGKVAEHADRIRRAVDRASRLVADLLDVHRIESGVLKLDIARHDADGVLDDALMPFRAVAASRGIRLVGTAGTKSLYVDRERVLQVLGNLVGNSVAYIAAGGTITVSIERSESGIRFTVRDTGPGMTPEQVSHAFERLWRGRHDRNGSGLGLYISREIARAHGGDLQIESSPEAGTIATVVMPQPPLEERQSVPDRALSPGLLAHES